MTIYIPSRSLRSASERCLVVPSQRSTTSLSRTFFIHRSWLVEWTSHPYPECGVNDNFQATPETLISSIITWLHLKKKTFLNFALFPLTSPCLDSICSEQCLELSITSTSCVCSPLIMYHLLYSSIVSRLDKSVC